MALRTRTFLATAVTLAVLFLALFGAVSSITERSFGTLEARDGAAAAARIVQAVRAELSRLQSVSGDWAPWDDTYQYVAGEYPEYPTDNLMTDALANLRADVFVIADASGRILFAGGSDLEGGGERDLPADLAAACATAARTAPLATLEATGGILQTRQGALLVAVHPITNNALDAPANGWLLVGRFLDAAEITALSQTTGLTTTVYLPSGSNPADVAGAVGRLAASGSDRAVAPLNDDLLATYVQMPLFGGGGTAIIRGVADRSAYRESRNTLGLFAAAFIAAGLVLVAANLIVLDRSVLRRLKNLSSFLHRVEAAGVETRVPVEGTDELTSIERNINSMLDALDTAHHELAASNDALEENVRKRTAELASANDTLSIEIDVRRRTEEQLAYLASHDYLTGLIGRRRFEEDVRAEILRADRESSSGAVVWIDLDDFKEFNDSLGHMAGDDILRGIAGVLMENVRGYTSVARLGGDEFALLLPNVDAAEAVTVAERVLEDLTAARIVTFEHPVHLKASAGVAVFPQHAETVDDLLVRADLALYHAKHVRRGGVCVYDDADTWHSEVESRASWIHRIDEALEEDRFAAWAQPIVQIGSGRIVRYELLVRMLDANGTVILPDEFLPAAEAFGRIGQIDRWMLATAVSAIAESGDGLQLDVNISGRTFTDPTLLGYIGQRIADAGIPAELLGLEITETAAVADIGEARSFIRDMRGLGCRVALDDFGTGFSSLHYLKQFEFDSMKIDGSFVRSLETNRQDQHLVKAVVEMARGLELEVTAEHVENAGILKLLADLGVDLAQGWHTGLPEPLDAVIEARRTDAPGAARAAG